MGIFSFSVTFETGLELCVDLNKGPLIFDNVISSVQLSSIALKEKNLIASNYWASFVEEEEAIQQIVTSKIQERKMLN